MEYKRILTVNGEKPETGFDPTSLDDGAMVSLARMVHPETKKSLVYSVKDWLEKEDLRPQVTHLTLRSQSSWLRNGPGAIWMSDAENDIMIEPVLTEIMEGDLTTGVNKDDRIARANIQYQSLKDRSKNSMRGPARPQRQAKDKAKQGLKNYNNWCKNHKKRCSRVGPGYQCRILDRLWTDRWI